MDVAACLGTGRGGCDAQMAALARAAGLTPRMVDPGDDVPRCALVVTTGPDRTRQGLRAARSQGVPIIGLGDPGADGAIMDLVLPTPQFPEVEGPNVVRLPMAISPHGTCAHVAEGPDLEALRTLPRPLGAILVGGPAGPWTFDHGDVYAAITMASLRSRSLVVLTSRRTPDDVRSALLLRAQEDLLVDRVGDVPIRFAAVMAEADMAWVTGESVSMVSEAALARIPTAIIPLRSDAGEVERYLGRRRGSIALAMPGDLRAFWDVLERDGPLDEPRLRTDGRDPVDIAATAVRTVMRSAERLRQELAALR